MPCHCFDVIVRNFLLSFCISIFIECCLTFGTTVYTHQVLPFAKSAFVFKLSGCAIPRQHTTDACILLRGTRVQSQGSGVMIYGGQDGTGSFGVLWFSRASCHGSDVCDSLDQQAVIKRLVLWIQIRKFSKR